MEEESRLITYRCEKCQIEITLNQYPEDVEPCPTCGEQMCSNNLIK